MLYGMFVGDSSAPRKSTMTSMVQEIVETVEPARIGGTNFTSEALVQLAAKKPAHTIFIEEGGDLFSQMRPGGYNYALRGTFCLLYDAARGEVLRSKQPPLTCKNAHISMLIGVAYQFLIDNGIDLKTWRSGFMFRFAFAAPLGPIVKRKQVGRQQAAFTDAATGLATVKDGLEQALSKAGFAQNLPMRITPGSAAEAAYDNALQNLAAFAAARDQQKGEINTLLARYIDRVTPMLVKIAMLYMIDSQPWSFPVDPMTGAGIYDHCVIDEWAIRRAEKFIFEVCLPSAEAALENTTTSAHRILQKIMAELARRGGQGRAVDLELVLADHDEQFVRQAYELGMATNKIAKAGKLWVLQ